MIRSITARAGAASAAASVMLAAGLPMSASAQVTTWTGLGDGVSFGDANNWSAGVPNASTDAVIDGNGGTATGVSITSNSVAGLLTIDAGDEATLFEGVTLTLNDGLANEGLLSLSATTPSATTDANLTLSGSQTLGGSGVIAMSDDADNSINTSGATIVTNGADHTIMGSGFISTFGFVNDGLIQATGLNVALSLDPSTGAFDNNGRIEALGAAGLRLIAGTFFNDGGVIFAGDGSGVVLASGADLRGGTLDAAGSGIFTTEAGTVILRGVTLTAGSDLLIVEETTITLDDGMTNNGTITLNATTSDPTTDANLTLSGSQTIGGNGSIFMADDADNSINTSGATIVTNGADHTILGSGFINAFGFVNDGLIQATGTSVALSLDPSTGGFVNNSRVEALGSAGLRLVAGTFFNDGGVFLTGDGSQTVLTSGVDLRNGILETAGSGFFTTESGTAILTSVTLTDGADVRVVEETTLSLLDGIVNNGVISLNAVDPEATTDANIRLSGSQTIGGTGSIVMSDNSDNSITTAGSTIVTNGADHTIMGSGSITTHGFVNNGLIQATGDNVALSLDPSTGGFDNNARVEALGSAGLRLIAGVFENTGGVFFTDDGSNTVLTSGVDLRNGTLETAGSGFFTTESGTATLQGMTIADGSDFRILEATSLSLFSGLTNNGTISLNATSSDPTVDANIVATGSQTIGGTGSIVMSDNSDNSITTAGSTIVTNGADHTIMGSGSITTHGFVNNGLIQATGDNVALSLDPSTGGFDNNARVEALGSAGLRLIAGVFENDGGVFFTADGSQTVLTTGVDFRGGTLESTGTGFIATETGTSTLRGVTLAEGSDFRVLEATTLSLFNGITNDGVISLNATTSTPTLDANITLSGSQTIGGTGSIMMSDDLDNSITTSGSTIVTNGSSHTIRGSGFITVFGLVNDGSILAEGSAGLTINPSTGDFFNFGTLGGTGRITFTDNLINDGTLAAGFGDDAALLDVAGDVAQTATANLLVEAGSGSADLIQIDGLFTAGGAITLELFAGIASLLGEEFTVLTATDGVVGNFDNAIAGIDGVATGVTSGDLTFDVTYTANSVIIGNIVPTPAAAITLAAGGLLVTRRRR